ncbi:MAG: ring-cleaving dioxygenase [Bryobacterales bacterium]|nr:ring-cleaving dioxygenase [Bryobacterales bacterium]
MRPIQGIHHVTAMSGAPQANLDFYAGVLGLRLVKLTVNYDDPGTYHLYYGDGRGSPGTILTFFPWPGAMRGRNGAGMATEIVFSAPAGSLEYWQERLQQAGVATGAVTERFGERVFAFQDSDGLRLAIAESAAVPGYQAWGESAVPAAYALQGVHSVTLTEADARATEKHLAEVMELGEVGREGTRARFRFGDGGAGRMVDVVQDDQAGRGRVSAGAVHHVAWRVADDETELYWQGRLMKDGSHVSPVMDRTYFHSIYWREPGGVLFEIATDPPGFTVDEAMESLGGKLILPQWLEPMREDLEGRLPKLTLPKGGR